jgi:hypothetical protein
MVRRFAEILSNTLLQDFNTKNQRRSNLAHLIQREHVWALSTMFIVK